MSQSNITSPELPDLDKLEALARAATPGEWKAMPHGRVVGGPLRHYVNGSAKAQIASFGVTFHEQAPEDEPERQQANADFAAAANPEQVLALIALARRAQPEGEAPKAEPAWQKLTDDTEINATCRLDVVLANGVYEYRRWYNEIDWTQVQDWRYAPQSAATLSPLCGAQHAESGKEVSVFANDGAEPDWSSYAAAEKAQQAAAPTHCDPAEGFCAKCRADERAAQQAAAPHELKSNSFDAQNPEEMAIKDQQAAAPAWHKVTGPGQVEVGARLRFNIGDKKFSERAKLILNAGAENEEVIYDKGRNFYFITSCVMSGFSNHKNVEFMPPKRAAQLDGGQEGSAT